MNVLSQPFWWGMLVVVGVVAAIIILTEIIDRLKRVKHPLAPAVQLVRDIILLLLAVLVMQRVVVGLGLSALPVRVVSTLFWLFVVVAIIWLANIFFRPQARPTWHDNIPRLVKRLPVYVAALVIIIYLLQEVWNIPLGDYAAALGIGSIAIAFALQDTLSNLVSGVLLILYRPFSEGDWIHVGDTEGRVVLINWRYTQIETRNGDLVVVPNGSIAQQSITNHSQPQRRTRVVEAIDVAYVNPPNKVKNMFMDTMLSTPGILHDPAPVVAVIKIDDPLMGYEVRYWIDDYADRPAIHNDFMTRIWYSARRHDVPFPSPAYDLYHYDGPTVSREAEVTPEKIAQMLRRVDTVAMLPDSMIEKLAASATFQEFARSESITVAGEYDRGLSIIIHGAVHLLARDATGVERTVEQLGVGAVFGESGLFVRAASPFTIQAATDAEIVRIDYAAMTDVINQYPQFAAGINAFVRKRRQAVQRLTETPGAPANGADVIRSNGHASANEPFSERSSTDESTPERDDA